MIICYLISSVDKIFLSIDEKKTETVIELALITVT